MSTEPVAIRGIVDDAPSPAVQRLQRARVFFAVALVAATAFTIGLDEAKHWRPAVDLGVTLNDDLNAFRTVAGGLAERSGLPAHGGLRSINDVAVRDHLSDFAGVVVVSVLVLRGLEQLSRAAMARETPTMTGPDLQR